MDDLFRLLSLGLIGAMVFVVVSNGTGSAQVLTGVGGSEASIINAIEGKS